MHKHQNIPIIGFFVLVLFVGNACTKDKGVNPDLAFKDLALLDSCKNNTVFAYYKNDPNAIYPDNNNSHGAFKLKFNKIAFSALTDNDKLPVGKKFPDGSMLVKEVYSGATLQCVSVATNRAETVI